MSNINPEKQKQKTQTIKKTKMKVIEIISNYLFIVKYINLRRRNKTSIIGEAFRFHK